MSQFLVIPKFLKFALQRRCQLSCMCIKHNHWFIKPNLHSLSLPPWNVSKNMCILTFLSLNDLWRHQIYSQKFPQQNTANWSAGLWVRTWNITLALSSFGKFCFDRFTLAWVQQVLFSCQYHRFFYFSGIWKLFKVWTRVPN